MNQTEDRRPAPKKILGLNPMVVVNVALLGVLGVVSIAPAQPASRARGDYAMVGGEYLGGGGANAVYILDAANQELIAIKWDSTRNLLDGIGFRDLAQDAKERAGR